MNIIFPAYGTNTIAFLHIHGSFVVVCGYYSRDRNPTLTKNVFKQRLHKYEIPDPGLCYQRPAVTGVALQTVLQSHDGALFPVYQEQGRCDRSSAYWLPEN